VHKYKTIRCISFKGKFLYSILFLFYYLTGFYFRKKSALYQKKFEENPLYFKKTDALYLGYKYYFEQPEFLAGLSNKVVSEPFVTQVGKNNDTVTLSLGGDLMPYNLIHPKHCKFLWNEIGSFYFNSDFVFANLETPIDIKHSNKKVPEIMLNHMLFNASEEQFDVFNGLGKPGFGHHILSTANNHSLDRGIKGINSTLDFLKKNQIDNTGTYQKNSNGNKGVVIEKSGIKFGFIAFTYSLNHLQLDKSHEFAVNHLRLNKQGVDLSQVKVQVDELKKSGAKVIVGSFHMGNAYQPYPSSIIRENAHRLIQECGVDIVACSHPHNIQPFEMVSTGNSGKQALIIYSLGDFVAYDVYTFCHLCWTFKLEFKHSATQPEQVLLSKIQVLPFYNMLDKSKQLHFIPIDINKGLSHLIKLAYWEDEPDEIYDYFCRFILNEEQILHYVAS
jgi:poly-gamma-glutamate capsule biosynthesis protein CapA/YwtB (metallophosphatase superfamily)